MEIKELNKLLTDRVEDVCYLLYPSGHVEGNYFMLGGVDGEQGRSLRVYLNGENRGRWRDYAGDDHGDLVDLWMLSRRIGVKEALIEIKNYIGVHEHKFLGKKKSFNKPTLKYEVDLRPESKVYKYLIEDRLLSQDILDLFRVKETKDQSKMIFQSFRDGELISAKVRSLDNKHDMKVSPGCEPCLFGWQAVDERAREVVITEGELDAMTVKQYGFNALSVPFGGGGNGKQGWIEHEYDNLERFDTVFLCLDRDEEGFKAEKEITNRLGIHRCRIVDIPFKDANECLQKGVTKDEFKKLIENASYIEPAEIKRPSELVDKIIEAFYPTNPLSQAYSSLWTGYEKVLRYTKPSVVVWSGLLNSGKSAVLDQVILDGILQNEKFLLMSFEMTPVENLVWITRQAGGKRTPTKTYIHKIENWLSDKLWVYDYVKKADSKEIFEIITYAVKRFGITSIIIDSLMKLSIRKDDYEGQKDFVNDLTFLAKQYNLVIHLVAHPRKPGQVGDVREENHEVGGAGEITALAHSVIFVHRNRKKEYLSYIMKNTNPKQKDVQEWESIKNDPDTVLKITKHRDPNSELGVVELYYDRDSMQFLLNGQSSRIYVPESEI